MKTVVVIPARYLSTRFPGKPLAKIGNKTMIRHVYDQALKTGFDVYVATDDSRIVDEVKSWNGNVVETSTFHKSGTERLAEAVTKISEEYNIVVNVQGDEPFIKPEQIKKVASLLKYDELAQISTLVKQIKDKNELFDTSIPKVIFDKKNYALYFSRSTIPFVRGVDKDEWLNKATFFKHIGIYGYKKNVLLEIAALDVTIAETAEMLEQLRWMQYGYKIKVEVTDYDTLSIDTPADLEKAIKLFEQKKEN